MDLKYDSFRKITFQCVGFYVMKNEKKMVLEKIQGGGN